MKKFSMALMAASMLTVPMFAEDSTPAAEATAAAPAPAATENKVSPWEQFPEVVGEYNGKKVTREDLAEYVANMQIPIPADMFNNPNQLAMIAPQIVDQMIMEQLLLDAAAEKGFVPNVERVKKYFNEAIEQLAPEQKEAQLEMIKADTEDPEMTIEKYVDMMAAKAEIQKSFAIQEYLDSLDFGEALTALMDKKICGVSFRTLKSQTGLDNTTVSNMKKGENLNKSNVVSVCLGIHIPFRVSNRMLQLAELSIDLTLPGKKGEENGVYDSILHLNWAQDYSDTYDELKINHYEYLIHQPPM